MGQNGALIAGLLLILAAGVEAALFAASGSPVTAGLAVTTGLLGLGATIGETAARGINRKRGDR